MAFTIDRAVAAWLLATATATSGAWAADGQGRFAGHGPGVARCDQLMQALAAEGPDRALFIGWVSGFLTAANAYKAETYDLAPWQPIEFVANVVAEQCTRNPEAAVSEVMVAVSEQLGEQRLRTNSPLVETMSGENGVTVYREVLRQAQARLRELGHDPGGVDGAYGPRTRAAIEAFQGAKGIPVTGVPDDATLLALFYDLVPQPASDG